MNNWGFVDAVERVREHFAANDKDVDGTPDYDRVKLRLVGVSDAEKAMLAVRNDLEERILKAELGSRHYAFLSACINDVVKIQLDLRHVRETMGRYEMRVE